MSRVAVINASHLSVVLAARRITTLHAPWCVMSAHMVTGDCRRGVPSYVLPMASTAQPMSRGDWIRALNRSACQEGAKAMRRIYGVGIKALRAEPAYLMERRPS